MKRKITLRCVCIACAFLLCGSVGCADDENSSVSKPRDVSLRVNADKTIANKTGNKLSLVWNAADRVGVFSEKTDNEPFVLTEIVGGTSGNFTGKIFGTPKSYYVYTPYDASATMNGSVLSFTIPETQTVTDGIMSAAAQPMVGVATLDQVQMKSLCGVLAVNVAAELDITVESIVLKSVGDEKIAGNATVDLQFVGEGDFAPVMSENGGNTISLTVAAGGDVAKSSSALFYIMLPPRTYQGAEVTVKTGTAEKTVVIDRAFTILRSEITRAGNVLFEKPEPPEEPKPAGTYLSDPARYNMPATEKNVYSNCYTVDRPGTYFLNARTIGNGAGGLHPDGGFHTNSVKIEPKSAALLWQDSDGAVTDVKLSDGGSYLIFNAVTVPANAVLAVYDGENGTGNILWSWHIWLTGKPRDHQYKNTAGQNTFVVMDRNLGALYAPPTDVQADMEATTTAQRFAAYGLQYQWGRKDPFWTSSTYNGVKDKVVFGQLTKIKVVAPTATQDEANNNLLYAIRNPVSFITLSKTLGWTNTPAGALWGNPNGFESNYPSGMKSIYDPCPVGYRVPPGNLWLSSEFDKVFVDSKLSAGRMYRYDGNNIAWYPKAGMRFDEDAKLGDTNTCGYYWTNTLSRADQGVGLEFWIGTNITDNFLNKAYSTAASHNIRCIKE